MQLFHNTTAENAIKIINSGFKKYECSDFGKAVYFSHDLEVAQQYGDTTIAAQFTGKLLDLSIPAHFEIFKKYNNEAIVKAGYDALKDGYIIAVYKTSKLINIRLHYKFE